MMKSFIVGQGSALRSLSAAGAALAMAAFVVVGVLLAVFFAATVAVLAVISSALLALTSLSLRARRTSKARTDGVIEARHIGGHNWVATGWEERR
jgi:Flp pilus assembly protein TadB